MKPANVCKNLRNKKMYIPALAHQAATKPEEENLYSGHCWCTCTLTEVGPDDQLVGVQVCTAGRACFEE